MRLSSCEVRDHINSRKNDHWSSHRVLQSLAAAEIANALHLRDFGAPRFSSSQSRQESANENSCTAANEDRWMVAGWAVAYRRYSLYYLRTPRSGIPGRATSICLKIGARSGRTDDVTIAMKPQPEPSAQEVLAGLVERVDSGCEGLHLGSCPAHRERRATWAGRPGRLVRGKPQPKPYSASQNTGPAAPARRQPRAAACRANGRSPTS